MNSTVSSSLNISSPTVNPTILGGQDSMEMDRQRAIATSSTPPSSLSHGAESSEDDSDTGSSDVKRRKKARTTFTGRQIFELEKQFEIKKYLSSSERTEMAKLLNVTETQVRQNSLNVII